MALKSGEPEEVLQPGPSVLYAMWRYKWMCVWIVLAFTALSGFVGIYLASPATATATLALKTPRQSNVLSPGIQGDASLARYTAQRAKFIFSDAVINEVARQIGEDDVDAVRKQITADPSTTSNVVNISVTASTPRAAVELAAATLAAYRSETLSQVKELSKSAIDSITASQNELRAQVASSPAATVDAAVAASLSQLQLQASDIESSSALLGDGVEFAVAPTLSSVQTAGLPTRELALGFLVGLIIAGSVAWTRADRNPEDTSGDDSRPKGTTKAGSHGRPVPAPPREPVSAAAGADVGKESAPTWPRSH